MSTGTDHTKMFVFFPFTFRMGFFVGATLQKGKDVILFRDNK